jgi:hypothetical protein
VAPYSPPLVRDHAAHLVAVDSGERLQLLGLGPPIDLRLLPRAFRQHRSLRGGVLPAWQRTGRVVIKTRVEVEHVSGVTAQTSPVRPGAAARRPWCKN